MNLMIIILIFNFIIFMLIFICILKFEIDTLTQFRFHILFYIIIITFTIRFSITRSSATSYYY